MTLFGFFFCVFGFVYYCAAGLAFFLVTQDAFGKRWSWERIHDGDASVRDWMVAIPMILLWPATFPGYLFVRMVRGVQRFVR